VPTVLITGANRGLGLEFARQYSGDGWRVIACCRTPGQADELRILATTHDQLVIERLDVTDFVAIEALGEKCRDEPIDVLLNNAGIIGKAPLVEHIAGQHFGTVDYEVWQEAIRTNTFAPVKMAETFFDNVAMSAQKKIVTISSVVASISEMMTPGVCYASSKTALNRAMTIVADKLRDRGIIVAMFCPGYVKTDMDVWGHATVEIEESISALRPLIAGLTIENTGSFSGHDGRIIGW
jgi:NAD(P)-dependent dehydrogenase (short-subunit alcohol dehydrogenase family)